MSSNILISLQPVNSKQTTKTMAGRVFTTAALVAGGLAGFSAAAGCPYAAALGGRAEDAGDDPLAPFTMDDSSGYMTDDLGGQITDQDSLKVGPKGPTLLEDFIFRQKITHCKL